MYLFVLLIILCTILLPFTEEPEEWEISDFMSARLWMVRSENLQDKVFDWQISLAYRNVYISS